MPNSDDNNLIRNMLEQRWAQQQARWAAEDKAYEEQKANAPSEATYMDALNNNASFNNYIMNAPSYEESLRRQRWAWNLPDAVFRNTFIDTPAYGTPVGNLGINYRRGFNAPDLSGFNRQSSSVDYGSVLEKFMNAVNGLFTPPANANAGTTPPATPAKPATTPPVDNSGNSQKAEQPKPVPSADPIINAWNNNPNFAMLGDVDPSSVSFDSALPFISKHSPLFGATGHIFNIKPTNSDLASSQYAAITDDNGNITDFIPIKTSQETYAEEVENSTKEHDNPARLREVLKATFGELNNLKQSGLRRKFGNNMAVLSSEQLKELAKVAGDESINALQSKVYSDPKFRNAVERYLAHYGTPNDSLEAYTKKGFKELLLRDDELGKSLRSLIDVIQAAPGFYLYTAKDSKNRQEIIPFGKNVPKEYIPKIPITAAERTTRLQPWDSYRTYDNK